VTEAHGAREAFLTSASTFVMPVTRIDGQPVGDGLPGRLTRRLRQSYLDYAHELAPDLSGAAAAAEDA
jgi:D-alanine transaminase